MQPFHASHEPETAEDALAVLLMTLGRRMRMRHHDDLVDPAQMPLLFFLSCRGVVRLNDIAVATHLDPSTVSRHAKQLLDKGLIASSPDPGDGRARLVEISDEGTKVLGRTVDHRRQIVAEALTEWSADDRESLRLQLNLLTESFNSRLLKPC
ncbi:MAG: MarR family transcriptional regulator [Actinomycetota bacterium]|nr:MarR family transcriptional regulator [Actinomycetota bacterium]